MPFPMSRRRTRLIRPTAVVAALMAFSAASMAQLAPFTFNPAAVGLNGVSVTADNILISDYSAVTFTGSTFSETGYLAFSGFQSGGTTLPNDGLNNTYGLYIQFTGTGTTTTGNPATTSTTGSFSSLTYNLYGYNGTGSFSFAGNTPTTSVTSATLLATGSLIGGVVGTVPLAPSFVPTASANLSFTVAPGESGFFRSPNPFYAVANTAFTNTTSTVEPFANGFRIRQGGGSVNFVSSVPEPSTYALLIAGLGAIGFSARRRRND